MFFYEDNYFFDSGGTLKLKGGSQSLPVHVLH